MPIYVKDGGTFREISSNAGTQLYVRDGTSFTNKTITNAYVKDGGSWRTVFTLFDTPASFSTATGSVAGTVETPHKHFKPKTSKIQIRYKWKQGQTVHRSDAFDL